MSRAEQVSRLSDALEMLRSMLSRIPRLLNGGQSSPTHGLVKALDHYERGSERAFQ